MINQYNHFTYNNQMLHTRKGVGITIHTTENQHSRSGGTKDGDHLSLLHDSASN